MEAPWEGVCRLNQIAMYRHHTYYLLIIALAAAELVVWLVLRLAGVVE